MYCDVLCCSVMYCDVRSRSLIGFRSQVVSLLLDRGAQIDFQQSGTLAGGNTGSSALLAASQSGNVGVVKMLVEGQADVNLQNKEGLTPLLAATQHGHAEVQRTYAHCSPSANNRGFR